MRREREGENNEKEIEEESACRLSKQLLPLVALFVHMRIPIPRL